MKIVGINIRPHNVNRVGGVRQKEGAKPLSFQPLVYKISFYMEGQKE